MSQTQSHIQKDLVPNKEEAMKSLTFKQKAMLYKKAQKSLNKSIRETDSLISSDLCPTAGEANMLSSVVRDLQRAQSNFIKARIRWTSAEAKPHSTRVDT